MNPYLAEFVGTALLILFGDGVCACVALQKSYGQQGGWMVITTGWGLAVMIGAYAAAPYSGAHLNPAVTVALASIGMFEWARVPGYIVAQILGAMAGALLVYLSYFAHWRETQNPDVKLGVFCTGPAIPNWWANFLTEFIGSFALIFAILAVPSAKNLVIGSGTSAQSAGFFGIFLIALIVVAIGLSLGGATGYAVNPARDFGPRLMHALLPIPGKRDSNWRYAPIPILAPLLGGIAGALVHRALTA